MKAKEQIQSAVLALLLCRQTHAWQSSLCIAMEIPAKKKTRYFPVASAVPMLVSSLK
jgi:hypothetical protein